MPTTTDGMVLIPAGKYRFKVSGVEIEGDDAHGVDVQYPWEDRPRRSHDKELDIKAFLIDKYPVTNEQFKQFLDATGYQPKGRPQFFARTGRTGHIPTAGRRSRSRGSRSRTRGPMRRGPASVLPHEWEWQYAAQGADGRLHPWGNADDAEAIPPHESGRELRPPTDVDAFPKGASPFGVMDMTGNVWQWTDEYRDEHTRAAILRGGSYYRPSGSNWYFPAEQAARSTWQVSLDGPQQGPFGDDRLPLRRRSVKLEIRES